MKSFVIFSSMLILYTGSFAQHCNQEELSKRPGKWKEKPRQGSLYDVTAKEVAAESLVLNQVDNMIRSGYHPVGTVAHVIKTYGYVPGTGANWIGNPFYYYIPLQKFRCINDKEYTDGGAVIDVTSTLFVYANSMDWVAPITASDLDADNKNGYVPLADMPIQKDGLYYFDLKKEPDAAFEAVLITKDGSLPYKYVTRKDFLQIRKGQLEVQRKIHLEDAIKKSKIRPAAEQEAAKQKEIASLKAGNYTQPYIDRYLKDYKTDEERKDAAITGSNKYYDTPLELISKLLSSSSDADLSQPAIIKSADSFDTFSGFVSDKEGMCLIKPNRDYYNKNLPRSSPQFFTVFYRWDNNDPIYKNAMAGIKQSINYQTLKNMLEK
jgi:hypothetical protein